ncbi:hypothetical protein [Phytohabitans rumicis]|uniref:DUF3558 domain-containing protein n=1 Tax=Phytohabitans rumicis TaxID=1076125 RepID=A0A6V8L5I7_9ACTN|nr:hypothetical protein [Phytohabitans rumicis]GFJ87905.1 hypothetical protein Prum_015470 [Phytohabitans rumicis]
MTDVRGRGWRAWWLSAAAVAVMSAAAACGSTPAEQPARAGDAAPASAGAAAEAKQVDVCALLTVDEVTQVIGAQGGTDPQARTKGNGGGSCVWENPDTYHSITVEIGGPGTAVTGKLPDESPYGQTEAGPDGIRFASGGIAEFVVRDRACEIQVVTNAAGTADRTTAVRLIGLVRGRA